jgi:hypothetical protein
LSKLPTQLRWTDFVAAIKSLGYRKLPSPPGSARHFQRGDEDPLTFHEPHGKSHLKQGTLREYLRKLGIDRDGFMVALAGSAKDGEAIGDEERFRRTSLTNGIIVSNCLDCLQTVAKGIEKDVTAAEAVHVCPLALAAKGIN